MPLSTPVALIIFKRPDTTEKVLQAIREVKPPKLLVVADGARADRPGEAEKCAEARAVVEQVDWDCEVLKNYSEANLGTKRRVESGLDWVFGEVEEAIILEDDCVPHPTFFRYCEDLLETYRDDERVMAICGSNFQFGRRRTEDSYYFSQYAHVAWGWASWRRAWKFYDGEMKQWPRVRDEGWLKDILRDNDSVRYWTHTFQLTYEGRTDAWDYPWALSCWLQRGLATFPNVNLVSNIGFGPEATHTTGESLGFLNNVPAEAMTFPLRHPPFVIQDTVADRFVHTTVLRPRLRARAKARMERLVQRRSKGV